jgi:hypothetical protein
MLRVSYQPSIASPWINMPPLRLGKIPSGLGTADLFVTIAEEDRPVLRVDLYAGDISAPFRDAIAWGERVFVGYGDSVYAIDPHARSGSTVVLGSYFAAFYTGKDYLLVASGQELLRLAPQGEVMWRASELGVDGVIVTGVEAAGGHSWLGSTEANQSHN